MKSLVLFLVIAISFAAAITEYDGYKVVRAVPKTFRTKERFHALIQDVTILKVLPVGDHVAYDVFVSPDQLEMFKSQMAQMNIEITVLVEDIQVAINNERKLNEIAKEKSFQRKNSRIDHTYYRTLDEINEELDNFAANYPSLMSKYSGGQSINGRDLNIMKVSSDGSNTKEIIWIDCGIHAREWITEATCLFILDSLSTYGTDAEVTVLLDVYDFMILTVSNPDGYDYSWTDDRMWRKNRFNSGTCYGVDVNRNFDSDFGGPGTSSNACLGTYHGTEAFSELESQVIRDAVNGADGLIKMFFSLHSYSQLWMYPYGYTRDVSADDDELDRVAAIGVSVLESAYGTTYKYGTISRTIYEAAGGSIDWTYDTAGIVYSYAIELRDTGADGFILPPDQIVPTATETWEGIKAAVNAV